MVSDGVEFFGTGIISNVIQDITGTLNHEENLSKNLLREDFFQIQELKERVKKESEEQFDEEQFDIERFKFIDELLEDYSDNLYLNAITCIKCIEELTFDPEFLKSLREPYNHNNPINGGLGSGVISLKQLYDFIDNVNIDYIDSRKLLSNITRFFNLNIGGKTIDTIEKMNNTDLKKKYVISYIINIPKCYEIKANIKTSITQGFKLWEQKYYYKRK